MQASPGGLPILATHSRMARVNLIGGDRHYSSPMPLDYFVRAVVSEGRAAAPPELQGLSA